MMALPDWTSHWPAPDSALSTVSLMPPTIEPSPLTALLTICLNPFQTWPQLPEMMPETTFTMPEMMPEIVLNTALTVPTAEVTAGAIALNAGSSSELMAHATRFATLCTMEPSCWMMGITAPAIWATICPIGAMISARAATICMMIGMSEIMFAAQTIAGSTYISVGPYMLAAIIYFVINYPTSKVIEHIERRMRRGDKH